MEIRTVENRYFVIHRDYKRICKGDKSMAGLLWTLVHMSDDSGHLSIGLEKLEKAMDDNLTRKTVLKSIARLESLGFLSVDKDAKKNQYHLNHSSIQNAIDKVENSTEEDHEWKTPSVENSTHDQWKTPPSSVENSTDIGGKFHPIKYYRSIEEVSTEESEPFTAIHGSVDSGIKPSSTQHSTSEFKVLPINSVTESEEDTVKSGTIQSSLPGKECMSQDKAEIIKTVLSRYAATPIKKRTEKGGVGQIMQKWGDRLMPLVNEVGEDLITSMEGFLKDEFWATKLFPLTGFVKQYERYISPEPPPSPSKREYQPREPKNETVAVVPLPVFCSLDAAGAIARKVEAVDILRNLSDASLPVCVAEIGVRITPELYERVEYWHQYATQAYREKRNREYPVKTSPIHRSAA